MLIVIVVFKNPAKCSSKVVVDGCNTEVEKEEVEDSERHLNVYHVTINNAT